MSEKITAICKFDCAKLPDAIIEGTIEEIRAEIIKVVAVPFQVTDNRLQFVSHCAVWLADTDFSKIEVHDRAPTQPPKGWVGCLHMGYTYSNIRIPMWQNPKDVLTWEMDYYRLDNDGSILSPSDLFTYYAFVRREYRTRGKRAKEWIGRPVQSIPTCPYCTGVA